MIIFRISGSLILGIPVADQGIMNSQLHLNASLGERGVRTNLMGESNVENLPYFSSLMHLISKDALQIQVQHGRTVSEWVKGKQRNISRAPHKSILKLN